MASPVEKAAAILRDSSRVLGFTGAGISTESGIPDFRSPGGIWTKYDPRDFTFQKYVASHENRKLYWRRSGEFYEPLLLAEPNAGHEAFARLEKMEKLLALVTQNIDGLHQRAGCLEEKVIEIHGTVRTGSCLQCGTRWPSAEIRARVRAGGPGVKDGVPYCVDCGGVIKTDTISFGQQMPTDKLSRSFDLAASCDACLVVGSSLVVMPAGEIPLAAKQGGAALIIVNREETPLDPLADVVIHEAAGPALQAVLDRMRGGWLAGNS